MKPKKTHRPIMFVGTGSDVGKSIINAAFCRIFLQDGYHPAPFKAQNMSLNSYATPNGLEIGRAQAVQAEAAGLDCRVEMNPILLKPTSHTSSQVVLHGKPIGNQSASEYFLKTDRDMLFDEAMKAYRKLHQDYNPIVIEGAGSISEINLRKHDITNMRIALETNAAVFLVADIDRGGVFGSVYGTIELLTKEERALVVGIVINKFRGDIRLFEKGRKMMEELTGIPVVGIVPYYKDIHIEDEDSVVLDNKSSSNKSGSINIAVVLLKHMSNFTDFNVLERLSDVHLYYTVNPEELEGADIIIIPGSKNTISDTLYLRNTGMAKALLQAHENGKAVYGICGGYQIMGIEIRDPHHVEGDIEAIPGLGILPVVTTLSTEKITEQCNFTFRGSSKTNKGYEIHMGDTIAQNPSPLCVINNNKEDGYLLNSKTWGTYIHGIFDNPAVIQNILKNFNIESKKASFDYIEFKEQQYNKLADHVRSNMDMQYIYEVLKNE